MPATKAILQSIEGPLDLALWAAAAASAQGLAWLDGDGGRTPRGRWSFLTWNPHRTLRVTGARLVEEAWHPDRSRAARRETVVTDPLVVLAQALASEAVPRAPAGSRSEFPVPWISGAIMTLAFELADAIEHQISRPSATASDPFAAWPDLTVAFYDSVLALDEATGRLWLAARIPEDRPPSGVLTTFEAIAAAVHGLVPAAVRRPSLPRATPAATRAPASYRAAVAAIQAEIAAGEVYQVNLSRALRTTWHEAPLELFERHRALGRMPHGAFLDLGGGQAVAAFTPERFLAVRGRQMSTSPIKGTRPRRASLAADRQEIGALLASAKDRAEHLMIVDLERNDLGRVAIPGSIRVDPAFDVESYASVHHLVSTVHGTLRPEVGPLELLRATFPGGSVTGAPKIRAIDTLRRLEGEPRRLYTGAFGYWDAAGDWDLALPIRTALVQSGAVEYRVGGGIVIDSDPDAEWQETEDKARAFVQMLELAALAPAAGAVPHLTR